MNNQPSNSSDKQRNIKGGYFLIARQIFDSCVMEWPLSWFKMWIWIIGQANHQTVKVGGVEYQRGEVLTSYKELQKVGSYKVGWRRKRPSKTVIRKFCEELRKTQMATTRKTTKGFFIKVLNYNRFQDPSNYGDHSEDHNETTMRPQTGSTINNKEKKEKKDKTTSSGNEETFKREPVPNLIKLTKRQVSALLEEYPILTREELTEEREKANRYIVISGEEIQNHALFFRRWLARVAEEKKREQRKFDDQERYEKTLPTMTPEQIEANRQRIQKMKATLVGSEKHG